MKNDQLISNWLEQQEESAELERLIDLTEKLKAPVKRTKEEAWDMLVDRINTESSDNQRILTPNVTEKKSAYWMYWAVGIASIFLIGYFGIRSTPKPTSVFSESADVLTYELPDNSLAHLNANSTITFIDKHWDKDREIRLSGEAFFEVEEGSTFSVITNSGEVQVLGTSFNVKERDNLYEVSCATGQVSVSTVNSKIVLAPGEKAFFNSGVLKKGTIEAREIGAWRSGDFYFNQTPLEAVIKELERQFEIDITLSPDITQRVYNGYFNKSNLTEALQLVFIPMGLQYEVEEKQVIVK